MRDPKLTFTPIVNILLMDFTIITENIVSIVVVIGLILSIIKTYFYWMENRRNVSLEFSYVDKFFEPSLGEIPFYCYVLHVKNLGKVSIIIDFAGFRWKNGEYIQQFFGSTFTENYFDFPYELKKAKTLDIEFPKRLIQNEISKCSVSDYIEIQGFIKDGDGKYYTSPPLEIPVEDEN